MRDMAATAGAAAFKVLVTATALIMSTALDRHFLRVTCGTDIAAICALAHERPCLCKCTFGVVDVTAMTGAAVDVAIRVERKLRRAIELRWRHVLWRRHADAVTVVVAVLPHE